MRKANKPPSEWLRLLCKDWAQENEHLVENADAKFMEYKPYMKGILSSQLLVRLSLQAKEGMDGTQPQIDFWRILGIEDEFDKNYIIAQVERFNILYNVRGSPLDDDTTGSLFPDYVANDPTAGLAVSPGGLAFTPFIDQATAVAAAAAAAAYGTKKTSPESSKLPGMGAQDAGGKVGYRSEQRRMSQERKEQRARDRELVAMRKAQERADREKYREERRRKKVEIREQRESHAKAQKEAAMRRAEELVKSNRVPIEITRGAAAAKAAAHAALAAGGASVSTDDEQLPPGTKKPRSAIVVSTAGDLHTVCVHSFSCHASSGWNLTQCSFIAIFSQQICTHAKNLWAKYNAVRSC